MFALRTFLICVAGFLRLRKSILRLRPELLALLSAFVLRDFCVAFCKLFAFALPIFCIALRDFCACVAGFLRCCLQAFCDCVAGFLRLRCGPLALCIAVLRARLRFVYSAQSRLLLRACAQCEIYTLRQSAWSQRDALEADAQLDSVVAGGRG